MAAEELTVSYYINHHLTNLTFGRFPDGSWGIAQSAEEAASMGFTAIHLDTMGFSLGLGLFFLGLFWLAARGATSGVPGAWQNCVEICMEFFDDLISSIFTHKVEFVAPMAMTIFFWILLMNLMDLIPVDWIPELAAAMGAPYFKIVPTTDVNITLGLALGVFLLVIGCSIYAKGFLGFIKELTLHPFPSKLLIPINLLIELSTLLAKPLSLGMRLFANLYAAEMIFILIAALLFGMGTWLFVLGGFAHWAWAVFHILVVPLQAFIFSVLAVVYLASAFEVEEEH